MVGEEAGRTWEVWVEVGEGYYSSAEATGPGQCAVTASSWCLVPLRCWDTGSRCPCRARSWDLTASDTKSMLTSGESALLLPGEMKTILITSFNVETRQLTGTTSNQLEAVSHQELKSAGGWRVRRNNNACNAGDPGSIPRLGRSPGEGNGNPLQYSCLENPMDRGAWWATIHGVSKSRIQLSN